MASRYFGGQYDSVKQAAYLKYITKSDNYVGKLPYQVILDQYTARIRLDILLGGHVIITDAMFFDGVYFQTLFLDRKKREDFINFLRLLTVGGIPPLIEIRQREKATESTLLKMLFRKGSDTGFIFSSIERSYVKNGVAIALVKAQKREQEFSSWDSFLKASLKYAEDSCIQDEIRQKIDILKYMMEVPPNILRTWDGKFDFKRVLDDAIRQERFKIRRTGDAVIDSVIKVIEMEISKPFPNRSKLYNEIAKKTEVLSRPPETEPEKDLERMWRQFLQVYNRTLGIQHYCDTFDSGEIPIDEDKINPVVVSEDLTQSTLQSLARDSWTEFGKKLNNLGGVRNDWLSKVWELENREKKSFEDAQKALDKLVGQILREYRVKPTNDLVDIVGGGASVGDDLMNLNGSMFLRVLSKIFKIAIQVKGLIEKRRNFRRDRANMIEYGQKFMPSK